MRILCILLILCLLCSCSNQKNSTTIITKEYNSRDISNDVNSVVSEDYKVSINNYVKSHLNESTPPPEDVMYFPQIFLYCTNINGLKCRNIESIIHYTYDSTIISQTTGLNYSSINVQIDYISENFEENINQFSNSNPNAFYLQHKVNDITLHMLYGYIEDALGIHVVYKNTDNITTCYFSCIIENSNSLDSEMVEKIYEDFRLCKIF